MKKKLLIVNVVALVAAIALLLTVLLTGGEDALPAAYYLIQPMILLTLSAPLYLYVLFAIVWGIIAIVKAVKNIVLAAKGAEITEKYAGSKHGNFWSIFVLVLSVVAYYFLMAVTASLILPLVAVLASIALLVTLKMSQKTLKAMVKTEAPAAEAVEEVAAAE